MGRKEKIAEETHDQIDYIMSRERDKIRISNCRTDTRAKIESRHYPLIAELQVQFTTLKKKANPKPKVRRQKRVEVSKENERNTGELLGTKGLKSQKVLL